MEHEITILTETANKIAEASNIYNLSPYLIGLWEIVTARIECLMGREWLVNNVKCLEN